jgi:hypothetical protein
MNPEGPVKNVFKKPPPPGPPSRGGPATPTPQTIRRVVDQRQKTDIVWLLVLLAGLLVVVTSPFVAGHMSQAQCSAWYRATSATALRNLDYAMAEMVARMAEARQCPLHTLVSAWPQAFLGFGGIALGAILHSLRRSRQIG